jgi:hypothetical protein
MIWIGLALLIYFLFTVVADRFFGTWLTATSLGLLPIAIIMLIASALSAVWKKED